MAVDKKYLQQSFPFFPSIMEHIFKNVSADIVWKLYQSCKFFFIKFRPTFANELHMLNDRISLDGNVSSLDEFNKTTKKFIFTRKIYFISTSIIPVNVLPCFKECVIAHLPNLPFNNFKKIVKYTEVLHLSETKIYFSDDTIVHFEDILSCIPQTYYLHVYHACYISSKTENVLPLIEKKHKFLCLTLLYIQGDIDTAKLYEFIVKNVQPRATVDVSFNNNQ